MLKVVVKAPKKRVISTVTKKATEVHTTPKNMSKPEQIAELIYTAATDGQDTLSYRAGEDALQLLDILLDLNTHSTLANCLNLKQDIVRVNSGV